MNVACESKWTEWLQMCDWKTCKGSLEWIEEIVWTWIDWIWMYTVSIQCRIVLMPFWS